MYIKKNLPKIKNLKGQKKKDEFKLTLKHLEIENLKKILRDLKSKRKNLEITKIKECNELKNDKDEILRLIKKSLNHLKNNIKYEKRITESLKNHIVNILDGRTKYEIIFIEEIQNYIYEKNSYNNNTKNKKINILHSIKKRVDIDNKDIECNDKNLIFAPSDLEVICDKIIERISENKENDNFANWRDIYIEEDIKKLIKETFVL